jgi:hypothetical protein
MLEANTIELKGKRFMIFPIGCNVSHRISKDKWVYEPITWKERYQVGS